MSKSVGPVDSSFGTEQHMQLSFDDPEFGTSFTSVVLKIVELDFYRTYSYNKNMVPWRVRDVHTNAETIL